MQTIEVRLSLAEADVLDAGEDIERLLELDADGGVSPPLRDILLALDDAITDVYRYGTAGADRAEVKTGRAA